MGVLRYFPGSEPERPAPDAEWVVPGLEPGATAEPSPPTRGERRAENVSLAALTRHDASEAELRSRLAARGVEEPEIDAEIERLKSVGLVDDAALAARLVASLRRRKGLGDGALRPALRARHLPSAVIDAALAENVEDDEAVHDRLQEVADDRARRLGSLPYEVAERRLTAYLMRKGYSGSAVRTAVRQALEGAGER
jgi:regulatory protein